MARNPASAVELVRDQLVLFAYKNKDRAALFV